LKKLIKLIINSIIGILLLFLINKVGSIWNFHIGINVFTALFVRNFRCSRCDIVGDIKTYNIEKRQIRICRDKYIHENVGAALLGDPWIEICAIFAGRRGLRPYNVKKISPLQIPIYLSYYILYFTYKLFIPCWILIINII